MNLNVVKELAALRRMTVSEMCSRYADVFGETTNGRHKEWLIKRIIYRMQVLAEGDLSQHARLRAAKLANDADIRRRPPKQTVTDAFKTRSTKPRPSGDSRIPLPGAIITRLYKGESLEAKVFEQGFERTKGSGLFCGFTFWPRPSARQPKNEPDPSL